MLIDNMNWVNLQEYLRHDNRLVFVVGSTEQHGFLSLGTDWLIPETIARQACDLENVAFAPPLPFGVTCWTSAYPGSLGMRAFTYLHLIRDLLESAYMSGFKRILILNGHGGNHIITEILSDLMYEHRDFIIFLKKWYRLPETQKLLESGPSEIGHGNWAEAFPFTIVSEVPKKTKPLIASPDLSMTSAKIRDMMGDGCAGGVYKADADFMERVIKTAVEDVREELRALRATCYSGENRGS